MKLHQLFESRFLVDEDEIRDWIRNNIKDFGAHHENNIIPDKNIIVHPNGVVDTPYVFVKNHVEEIKVQFGKVENSFSANESKLKSLVGSPREVGRYLIGSHQVTSIEGIPQIIHEDLSIQHTRIRSLDGIGKISCKRLSLPNVPKGETISGMLEILKIKGLESIYFYADENDQYGQACNLISRCISRKETSNTHIVKTQREMIEQDLDDFI